MKIATFLKSLSKNLLLLTFFVPIVVTRFSMFPLVFGKTVFFNSLVELAVLFFALALLTDFDSIIFQLRARFSNKKINLVLLAGLLYLSVMILSTVFAQSHYTSFWGSPDRNDGLFAYLHYAAFIFLAYSLFSKKDWLVYASGFVVITTFTAAVAWAQYIGFNIDLLYRLNASTQPGSYAGNPAYLGAYLTMFLAFFAGLYRDISFHTVSHARYKKVFLVVFVLFLLATILITGIRGELLGIIAGVFMYGLLKLFTSDSKRIKIAMSSILIAGILLTGIFIATRNNPFWLSIPTVKRFTSVSFQNASVITRLYAWKAAMVSFSKNPILGSGHESFNAVFNKLGSAAVSRYGDEWFDRPHNKIVEVMVNDGGLGLLSYLFLLGTLVYVFRKEHFFIACFTAYFVQNLFIFDNNITSVLLSATIALAAQKFSENASFQTKNVVVPRLSAVKIDGIKFASLVSALIAVYLIFSLNLVMYKQQLNFGRFVKTSSIVERSKLADAFLYPFTPMQPRTRMQLVEFLRDWNAVAHPEAHELVAKSIKALEEAVRYEPYEARYYMRLGEIYSDIAAQDKQFYVQAENYSRKGIEVAPTQQKLYYLYAFILGRQYKYDLAIDVARKGVEIDPGTARAHLYLALPGIAASEKSTNPYYNPSDAKFAQYRKEGIASLYKSFELASQLVDGSPMKNLDEAGYTQFHIYEKTDFTNMCLLFSRAGDVQKTIDTATIGLLFYKDADQLYQYLLGAQIVSKDVQAVTETINRIEKAPYANKLPISKWRQNVAEQNWSAFTTDSFVGRYIPIFASPQTDQAVSK